MFASPLSASILKRAQEEGLLTVMLHDLKEYGLGNYKQVDDAPYGGGAGMVMRADVAVDAIETVCSGAPLRTNKDNIPYRIYLSPRGQRLTQSKVEELATHDHLLLLCGRYEGIDQRVMDGGFVDEEISIGDYVLTGGELPAMVLIDSVARLLPGVVGTDKSTEEESFSKALDRRREYPHYTRPEEFRGLKVPEVLLGGNHAEIAKWRSQNLR